MKSLIFIFLAHSIAGAAVPSFNKDIAPILHANCTSCHRPGEVGPFPLITYQDARKRARQIAEVTQSKVMPPWKPAGGHGKFKNARILKDSEIAMLKDWVAGGRIEGDPSDLPEPPVFPTGWHAGEPDMILKVAKPFTIPAEGPDIYVHFVIPLDLPEDKYVRGTQIRPTDRRVAHHGVIMLDGSGKARELAANHGGDHYPHFGGPCFIPKGFLPGYAPGMITRIEPKGSKNEMSFTLEPVPVRTSPCGTRV